MIRVGVSGAAGRVGRYVCQVVAAEEDLELRALHAPGHAGEASGTVPFTDDPERLAGCDVVVEVTRPEVVMENLGHWQRLGLHAVVGTSGFDQERLASLRQEWTEGGPRCLVVPNFSIGAVLMMRFAELAAPHFEAGEVVELHHDRKVDAPSGTAFATAARMASAGGGQRRQVDPQPKAAGARGARVDGVPVHSLRLPGALAHQEVIFGNPGELFTVRHESLSLEAFRQGILVSIRGVAGLDEPVTVGLDGLLGI